MLTPKRFEKWNTPAAVACILAIVSLSQGPFSSAHAQCAQATLQSMNAGASFTKPGFPCQVDCKTNYYLALPNDGSQHSIYVASTPRYRCESHLIILNGGGVVITVDDRTCPPTLTTNDWSTYYGYKETLTENFWPEDRYHHYTANLCQSGTSFPGQDECDGCYFIGYQTTNYSGTISNGCNAYVSVTFLEQTNETGFYTEQEIASTGSGLACEYTTSRLLQQAKYCAINTLAAAPSFTDAPASALHYLALPEHITAFGMARWRVAIAGTSSGQWYKLTLYETKCENGVFSSPVEEHFIQGRDADVWYWPESGGQLLELAQRAGNCEDIYSSITIDNATIEALPLAMGVDAVASAPARGSSNAGLPIWTVTPSSSGCSSCASSQSQRIDIATLFSLGFGPGLGSPETGSAAIRANLPSPLLATPDALQLSDDPTEPLEVLRLPHGELRQIVTPTLFINITNASDYQYTIQVLQKSAMGQKLQGLYTWTNDPALVLKTFVVDNPDASPTQYNRLRIRDFTSGTNEWMFTYSNSIAGWHVTLPANTGFLELISTNHSTNAWTYIQRHGDATGLIIAQHLQVFTNFSWGAAIVEDTLGTGADARARLWTYYDPPPFTPTPAHLPIKTIMEPEGAWRTILQYTNGGLISVELSAIDSGVTEDTSKCRRTTYWYTPVDAADNGSRLPQNPRKIEEYWKDLLIRKTYHVYSSATASPWYDKTIECPNPANAPNAPQNLISIVYRTPNTGEVLYQSNPDGTIMTSTTSVDLQGTSTALTDRGEPWALSPDMVISGTRTETVRSGIGTLISETTWALSPVANYPTATVIISGRTNTLDAYGRPTQTDYLNGTHETLSYSCCGPDVFTDRNGITRRFEYDPLHRYLGTTVLSYSPALSITNILDTAGRVTATIRNGGGSWPIVQNRNVYDTAGRVVYDTNALGGPTTHIQTVGGNSARMEVTIHPDGGAVTNQYAADGSLTNVSGTVAFPSRYEFGVELESGVQRFSTKEIKPAANGGTDEWTKQYQDGLGRVYKSIYAAAAGAPAKTSYFNPKGQLEKEIDPDGVTTLYRYNAQGELVLTATDLDKNGVVSDYEGATGKDRVTLTTNVWLAADDADNSRGMDLKRTVTVVWTADNSGALAKVNTVETSADGLHTWQTVYRDQDTPVVTTTDATVPTQLNNWTRTVIQTAPDNSSTATVQQYGRQISTTRYDSLGAQLGRTTFAYDAHGRQAFATDARNGTTSFSFNDADQVTTTVSPDPGIGPQVTTAFFDKMGRATGILNPDGTTTTNVYFPNGLLQKTWGSRMYPVEYTYDAQGRMRTNKTWQSFSAGTGTAITRWNYDQYRGWLKSKDYPDPASGVPPVSEGTSGPLYTYTPGGRLSTRTWLRAGTGGNPIITTYKYGFNDTPTDNEHGDLVSVQYSNDPAGTPGVAYGYDRRGRRTQVTRDGITTMISLNDANQQTGESYSGGLLNGLAVNATYNNYLQRDSLSLSGAGAYSVSYGYTAGSRLGTVSDSTSVVGYSYIANSTLIGQVFFTNSGALRMTTTRQFDRLNRLQSISWVPTGSAAPTLPLSHSYVYNSANQRIRATLADGSYWIYTYDFLGQVSSGRRYWQDGTPVAGQQFEYGFDDIGNRKATAIGGDAGGGGLRTASYTPNRLNQYSSRTVPGAVDFLGIANPTAAVTVNGNTAYRKGEYFDFALPVSNGSAPQYPLVSIYSGYPPGQTSTGCVFVAQSPESFTHDADGNLTADGRFTYGWDAENRLVQVVARTLVGPQQFLQFDYDWQGRRIRKRVWNNTGGTGTPLLDNKFLYDGWNLLAELNATNNTIVRSYVWGLDLSGSLQGAGGIGAVLKVTYNGPTTTNCFVTYDGNGNATALIKTDDASAVARYEYGPFGETIRATGPASGTNPFRFSTKYQDDETDLLYYGYRYYNASAGRWINRDPLYERGLSLIAPHLVGIPELRDEDAMGGLYCFIRNDSVGLVDILGLSLSRPWRECTPPKAWDTKTGGTGVIPPADGCSVPKGIVIILFPDGADKDNPTGKCSFKPACDGHDYCYSNCKKSKESCDDDFRKGMKQACDNCASHILGDIRREIFRRECHRWADIYYKAVSKFGEDAYKNRQVQNCECVCTKCENPNFCVHPN